MKKTIISSLLIAFVIIGSMAGIIYKETQDMKQHAQEFVQYSKEMSQAKTLKDKKAIYKKVESTPAGSNTFVNADEKKQGVEQQYQLFLKGYISDNIVLNVIPSDKLDMDNDKNRYSVISAKDNLKSLKKLNNEKDNPLTEKDKNKFNKMIDKLNNSYETLLTTKK